MIYPMLFLGVVVVGTTFLNLRLENPAVSNAINAWILLTLWSVLLVALSAEHLVRYASDMWLYLGQFRAASDVSFGQFISGADRDVGFSALIWAVAHLGVTGTVFRAILVGLVASGCLYAALRLFDDPGRSLLIFFVSTLNPVFFAYATNTVRQGVAIAMLVGAAVAVAAGSRRSSSNGRPKLMFLVLIGAPLIHLSALAPSLMILMAYLRMPKIRTALLIWILGVLVYSTGWNRALVGPIAGLTSRSSGYMHQYVNSPTYYSGGVNRLDFLAVSALILVACALFRKRVAPADLPVADRLLVITIMLNSYFLYLGFLTYSDRIAAYSWFMAPFAVGAYALAPSASRLAPIVTLVGALGIAALVGFPLLAIGGTT